MNVTKRSIIISFILLVICLSGYIYTSKFKTSDNVDRSSLPSYIMYDSTTNHYDELGRISRTLTSTKTTYYDDNEFYEFENPLVSSYSYSEKGYDLWHIKGLKGTFKNEQYATISENVVAYPGFEDSTIKKIISEDFFYDLKKNLVTSESEVTVFGQSGQTIGKQFSFDLNSNQAQYKEDPHATFYPATK